MVTVRDDDEILAQAFAMGATNYIVKPIKEIVLLARVHSALKLKGEIDRRKAREQELIELTQQLETINRRLMQMVPRDGRTEVDDSRDYRKILIRKMEPTLQEATPLSLLMVDFKNS